MLPGNNYKLRVRLLSEAIFSSGEKERNLVQVRALTDRHGFVYFHAKSLKGQLKRQAFWLLKQYRGIDKQCAQSFFESIVILFGVNKEEIKNIYSYPEQSEIIKLVQSHPKLDYRKPGIINFGHLELDERIKNFFIALQAEDEEEGYYKISAHDLIEAQTNIRTGIQVQDGIAKDKMLTSYHTVKKGLVFYANVSFNLSERELTEEDLPIYLADFQRIVSSFRRIGAGIHRGRGEIDACLLYDDEEIDFRKFVGKEGERHVYV